MMDEPGKEIEVVEGEVVDAEPMHDNVGLWFDQYHLLDRDVLCFRLTVSDQWMRVHEAALWRELTTILEELRVFVVNNRGTVRYESVPGMR